MQISSYLFQSRYSQPVQIGRPDPAMLQEQQKETQQNQQQSQQGAAGVTSSAQEGERRLSLQVSGQTTGSVLQTNQMAQQLMQTFQVANRSNYIQAYVQNSQTS
jgi:hypothetical protein